MSFPKSTIKFPNLLSEFVYNRTYARWVPEKRRRETWDESVDRYIDYVFDGRDLPDPTIRERARSLILSQDVLPSMRALWCAGETMDRDNICAYNCLGAETEFITREGVRRFSDFEDGDKVTVLTHTGSWKPAVVRSYGQQKLFDITVSRGRSEYTIRATRDHQWVLKDGSRTRELRLRDHLAPPPQIAVNWDYYNTDPVARNYWALGYVYGDGTLTKNKAGEYVHSMVRLCGNKMRFLDRFEELGYTVSYPPSFGGDAIAYTGHYLKTLPTIERDGYENVVAFVRGYLDADGNRDTGRGDNWFSGIQSSNESSIEFIRKIFPAVGVYISREKDITGQETNYGVRPKTSLFGLVMGFGNSENSTFGVKSIRESGVETVWCLDVEDDHSFVFPNGIVTGNCSFAPIDNLKVFGEALFILMCGSGFGFSVERQFVNNLPVVGTPKNVHTNYIIQDSTEGWADAVYFAMVQGHAGHSVTYDYSRIRPKGARLRTKGGRASGPEPLKRVLDFIAETLRNAAGRRLKPIECHDILCTTAEIVMVGGFRRSSLISFSDVDDAEMRAAKDWSGGNTFPAIRYMANNSATYDGRPTRDVFDAEWAALRYSGSGERGFLNVSSRAIFRRGGVFRTNPCVTGDTRVMTDRGMERMDAFLGRSRGLTVDTRFGTDGTGLTPTGSFTSGVKAVYKLRTREGYSLRCTADHKIRTPRGWVPAGELKADDEILIVNRHGMFGTRGDANIGMLAGWLTGDGSIWEGVPRFYYYGEKRELTQRMADAVCAMTGSAPTISRYEPNDRDTIVVPGLRELLGNMPKDRVPEFVWQGTEECQRAYVSALFSADGSVQGTTNASGLNLRLSASTLSLLQDIQVLLTNFGIVSKIYEERRPAGYRDLPDGKGGYASVMCAAEHELVIGKANVGVFLDRIGFMLSAKQQKAQAYRQNMPKGLRNEKFVARVLDFTYEGDEEVFDLTEATTHSFVANGIVISNCGEIKLRFKLATNAWTGEGGGGQGCNLSAAVMRAHDTIETMAEKVRIATWLGAIQATYTHFPYLRPGWEELCREDRLTGVDITGQCDNPALSGDDEVMAYLNAVARGTAIVAASALKINVPAAITCGKPSGNCRPWYALTTTDQGILTLQDLFARHPTGHDWAPVDRDIRVVRPGTGAQKILRTYDNGVAPITRLNLLYGLSVESTPEHRWFVKYRVEKNRARREINDWVSAKDIRPGDVLDVQVGTYTREEHAKLSMFNSRSWHMATNSKSIRTPEALNEDLCWFLGYLWGDGAMSPGGFRFRFCDENDWNLAKIQRILLDQFGLESTISRPNGRKDYTLEFASVHLWHWFLENGVFKYNAKQGVDIIPTVVRSSARCDIIAFIAGLLDSDGWAGFKRHGLGSFTLTTASEMFARHIQDVAWAVGLGIGRSVNRGGKGFQTERKMYLLGCGSQILPGAFDALARNSNKIQRAMRDDRFRDWEWRQAKRVYHVGRVVSVEACAPMETFDIEVDVDHWYMAGAVKSHNSSQLVDCASGFHTRYARYYYRHVRISAKDPLFRLIRDQGIHLFPENGQEHLPEESVDVWVARFPVKSPEGAKLREHERAIEQCNRYLAIMRTWCGEKGHNQSATIYVRESEWNDVGDWLYENFDEVSGLSFLPYDESGTKYRLPPYQEITAEEYERAAAAMPDVDFSLLPVYETDDDGDGSRELACVSGACEI